MHYAKSMCPRNQKREGKSRHKTRPTPKPRPAKAHSPLGPVAPEHVQLVQIRGTPGRGGDVGGEAWKIMVSGKRTGVIFINHINELPIGIHASIQIFLNKPSQGRQIGRIAYRVACESSKYDIIYAYMRKSNIASRRAAEEAGFKDMTPIGYRQLIMQRRRIR